MVVGSWIGIQSQIQPILLEPLKKSLFPVEVANLARSDPLADVGYLIKICYITATSVITQVFLALNLMVSSHSRKFQFKISNFKLHN